MNSLPMPPVPNQPPPFPTAIPQTVPGQPLYPPSQTFVPTAMPLVSPPYSAQSIGDDGSFPQGRGRMILLVGPPGIGKTSLAAQFTPGYTYWIIDPKESGILDLMESGAVRVDPTMIHTPINEFPALQYLLTQIIGRVSPLPPRTRTLVIESVSGFEMMARTHCCSQDYKNDWSERGFMNYQNGFTQTANGHWSPLITQLCKVREMGYNIILTGHSYTAKVKNKSGVDYLQETCNCHDKVWNATHQFFENLFFLSYDVSTERGDKKDNIAMGIGKAKGYTKMLYVNATPYQNAKNKFGTPVPDIEADCTPYELYHKLCAAARWNPMTLRYIK